jgi:hypothetical protein
MAKRPSQPDCYDYIRRFYGVPANVGQRVRVYGKGEGVLVRKRGTQQYIWIRLVATARIEGPYHPTDGIEYLESSQPAA